MPVGVLIDVGSVFLGGLLGGQLGSRLPEKLKKDLTLVFGVSSMAMGVTYLGKVSTLPAVILSVILGLMIGETVHLDGAIRAGAGKMNGAVSRLLPKSSAAMDETRMHQLVSIIVLICASGTGIFGALDSGLTGDHTVLCTKAILDFFTAAIFASSLGSVVAFVALPQLILQLLLFFSAGLILGLLKGWNGEKCVQFAAAASCLKHSVPGDFPILDMEEIERLADYENMLINR